MRFDLDANESSQLALPDSTDPPGTWIWIQSMIPESRLGVGHIRVGRENERRLFVIDLDTGTTRIGSNGIRNPRFVPGGFLTYQLESNSGPVVYRSINIQSGELEGLTVPLIQGIGHLARAVGREGSLLFAPDQFRESAQSNSIFLFDLSLHEVR